MKERERETARSLLKLDFSILCILRHDSSTTSSLPCYLHVQGSSTTFEKVSNGSSEGLNRLNRQLLKDQKINLQLSRKVNFHYLLSKVKISINLQNVSKCFKSYYFSWSSQDSRGSEWGVHLSVVGCRLKFSYFVGSRLKFSIFVGSRLNFLSFVGCPKISVNK